MVKISNFINLTVKWNICNVPSYHYLTEVDFTEVIEPYGYLLLIRAYQYHFRIEWNPLNLECEPIQIYRNIKDTVESCT